MFARNKQNAHNDARIIAITSGKGGVGKTNLSVSLSIALAQLGKKVVLIDMDLGMANADVILNAHYDHTLNDVINDNKHIDDVIVDVSPNLKMVPGVSGDENLANLSPRQTRLLVDALEHIHAQVDYIVLDIGAGLSEHTIALTASADDVIVVSTPEPTAMVDAYAMLKAVHNRNSESRIHIVMNMARTAKEAKAAMQRMNAIASLYATTHLENDGYILFDNAVGDAVRKRSPVLVKYPDSNAAIAIKNIAVSLDEHMPSMPVETVIANKGFVNRMLEAFTVTTH